MKLSGRQIALVMLRALRVVPVILLATLIVFGLQQLVPGDLAVTLAGESATSERVHQIRELYGLDLPLIVQYGRWLGHVLTGDLSKSLLSGVPVVQIIAQKLPTTLTVVFLALILSMLIGIPLGILAATRKSALGEATVSAVASVGVAMPSFWLAMILLSIFSISLHWLPATGAAPFFSAPVDSLRHAVLPALALAAGGSAEVARQLRSGLIEILGSQYIRTLRAKGLSPFSILWKHGLKNVSVNLVTVAGLLFNRLLGATVVIEAVFAIPGLGSIVASSAVGRDFPVTQGVVLVMVILVIATNALVNLLCVVLDPRVGRT